MLVLEGRVKIGRRQGKKLGFSTINIVVPRSVKKSQWGIYFSLVKIGDKLYPAITHLGPLKTFNFLSPTCETHILNFKENLYDTKVTKRLVFKFREVEKFPSLYMLKKQIRRDIKSAKRFFGF